MIIRYFQRKKRDRKNCFFRVISNQVRFGYGFRTVDGRRQYFAWHGYPNRSDDYFTTSEISFREFCEIEKAYPREIVADRDGGSVPPQIRRRPSRAAGGYEPAAVRSMQIRFAEEKDRNVT